MCISYAVWPTRETQCIGCTTRCLMCSVDEDVMFPKEEVVIEESVNQKGATRVRRLGVRLPVKWTTTRDLRTSRSFRKWSFYNSLFHRKLSHMRLSHRAQCTCRLSNRGSSHSKYPIGGCYATMRRILVPHSWVPPSCVDAVQPNRLFFG